MGLSLKMGLGMDASLGGASVAPPTPLSIDGTATGNSSAASTTVNLTTTKANDIIVVFALVNVAGTGPSVASSPALTWAKRAGAGTATAQQLYEFWALAPSAGTYAITVTPPSASFTTVTAFGVNGANTASPYDINAALPYTHSAAGSDPASVSTSAANTIVFGAFRMVSTANPTQGAGFTAISGSNFMGVEYKIVSATQSGLSVGLTTGSGNSNGSIGDAIVQGAVAPPGSGLRQVATNTYFPNTTFAPSTQLNSSTPHFARSALSSLQVVFANAYGLTELNIGAATITASVEYPLGTFTQFKFSGVTIGSVAGGALLKSDALSISIPNGARFNIRSFYQCSGGIIYYSLPFSDSQFLGENAASGLTDKTMGGTIATSPSILMPVALLAVTAAHAVAVIGDSISYGTFAGPSGTGKDIGVINASLGPGIAVLNLAAAGEAASGLYANYALRKQLLQYVTGAYVGEGNNDIQTGASTAAQLITSLITITAWPELSGKKLLLGTLFPKVNNSGDFLTRGSQTPWPTESVRVTANDTIRPGVTGYSAIVDFANVMEGGIDLGTWTVDGSGNALPQDGTHPTVNGANFGAASGVLTAGMF